MKESHKAKETKERFKKAFFSLYEERKIETITIKEVASLAGFNRGTFYLYYKSIYDLLQKTEQEILDDFKEKISYHIELYYGINDNIKDCEVDEFKNDFLRHGEYIKVLNGENGDPRFKFRMKNIAKEAYRKHLGMDNKKVGKFEYLLEYITEANMSIIQYWLCNGDKDQPRVKLSDISEIMHYVSDFGFKKAIEKYKTS